MAKSPFDQLGIGDMPWVVRAYLTLLFVFVALLVAPAVSFLEFPVDTIDTITSVASDGLKLVLGAVLGSLSMAAESKWKPKELEAGEEA